MNALHATRTLSALPFALAATLVACSSAPSDAARETTGTAQERVIGGKTSDSSQDAVVLVFFLDQKSGLAGSCTGTLLASNLVLTARHCVSDTAETAACDVDGNPIGGSGSVFGQRTASSLMIFKGAKQPTFLQTGDPADLHPDGVGTKIFDDGASYLCNHDVALILLKDPIAGASIAPIRLASDPKVGETFTAVGWGVTDSGSTPATRQQRTGISIEDVGPDMGNYGPLPPNEFQVGESICEGDSGGPAIATKTGAVIGVVSRGGNGKQPSSSDPAAGCINAMNIYTKVEPFKQLLMKGYAAANADPWLEGGPDPRKAKVDETCAQASDCRSNICLADPGKAGDAVTCAQDCADGTTACPDGETCQAIGDQQVCRTPAPQNDASSTTTKSGCTSGGHSTGSTPGGGVLALVLGVLGATLARRVRSRARG
jgi:hypothetical protein